MAAIDARSSAPMAWSIWAICAGFDMPPSMASIPPAPAPAPPAKAPAPAPAPPLPPSAMGSFIISRKTAWFALISCRSWGSCWPIWVRTAWRVWGLDWTRRRRASNCGWLRRDWRGPPLLLPAAAAGAAAAPDARAAAASAAPGGMPFMRNSTATSGLPPDARRQALTSASGKPMEVRLPTISAGNSSSSSDAAAAGAGAAAAAAGAGVADSVDAAAAAGAAAAAAGAGADDDSAAAGAGAGAFLALVIITTRKSVAAMLHDSMVSPSLRTLPEWMSFIWAAGSSALADSMIPLASPTVLDGSTSTVNFPPLRVLTVNFIVASLWCSVVSTRTT
mmetsp:Transcript_22650/g.53705  ORF Transcript_22650/g.53705 Transcript_22650/m.53705 type:complete len:334 (-) Transcript_22650:39-1040(-)